MNEQSHPSPKKSASSSSPLDYEARRRKIIPPSPKDIYKFVVSLLLVGVLIAFVAFTIFEWHFRTRKNTVQIIDKDTGALLPIEYDVPERVSAVDDPFWQWGIGPIPLPDGSLSKTTVTVDWTEPLPVQFTSDGYETKEVLFDDATPSKLVIKLSKTK